jgi:hypothetical protein
MTSNYGEYPMKKIVSLHTNHLLNVKKFGLSFWWNSHLSSTRFGVRCHGSAKRDKNERNGLQLSSVLGPIDSPH